MFRREINPKTAAVAIFLILASVQLVYWRLLVFRPTGPPTGGGGGGAAAPSLSMVVGREDVQVEDLCGGGAGFRDGEAWQAQFSGPAALAPAPDGALLVADSRNHRIRKIEGDRTVSTVVGGAVPGGPGGRTDGPALEAQLRFPAGVAAAPDGTLYVADTGNHRICKVTPAPDARLTTLAGGTEGKADGVGAAARFRFPGALTFEGGALWVADFGNAAIRRIAPNGSVSTPPAPPATVLTALGDVSASPRPIPMQACPEGKGYPEDTEFTVGRRTASIGGTSVHLYADAEHHVVLAQAGSDPPLLLAGRRVPGGEADGTRDGSGMRAGFSVPCAVLLAENGTAYVADCEGNRIRRMFLPAWLLANEAPPEYRRGRARLRRD